MVLRKEVLLYFFSMFDEPDTAGEFAESLDSIYGEGTFAEMLETRDAQVAQEREEKIQQKQTKKQVLDFKKQQAMISSNLAAQSMVLALKNKETSSTPKLEEEKPAEALANVLRVKRKAKHDDGDKDTKPKEKKKKKDKDKKKSHSDGKDKHNRNDSTKTSTPETSALSLVGYTSD